jgi:hypothetical protein
MIISVSRINGSLSLSLGFLFPWEESSSAVGLLVQFHAVVQVHSLSSNGRFAIIGVFHYICADDFGVSGSIVWLAGDEMGV